MNLKSLSSRKFLRIFACLAIVTASLTLTSCTKDTTYYISSYCDFGMNLTIFECDDNGNHIKTYSTYISSYGYSRVYDAARKASKVKIYIDDFGKWINQSYYLPDGGHKEICIYGSTSISPIEPYKATDTN